MNGIFAIEKPSGITSNQFMLKLQHALTKSQVFSKEIQRATAERKQQYEKETGKKVSKRKLRKVSKVKMGHGGTLDPLASGVLVIGIGTGTKKLANYLSGTVKVYESEALFGVSTTSGDVEGEILSQNSVKNLNFDDLKTVEEKFVGQLKQTPPIYAALKMDGKPLHEYAREGKPLPRAIEPRQVTIYDLKVYPDSLKRDHDYPFLKPKTEEAVETVKNLNANMLNDVLYFSKEYTEKHGLQSEVAEVEEAFPLSQQEEQEIQKEGESYRAPKLHFKANVSSGTYIRSLVSDIGKSMRSSCYMVKLIRLQQQDWSLERNNVFQLADFTERDEKVWGKVLKKVLDEGASVDVIEELKKAEKEVPADVKEGTVPNDQFESETITETKETADVEQPSNTLKRKIEQV